MAHPSFDDPAARDAILGPMPALDVAQTPRRSRVTAGSHSHTLSLPHDAPLLSREQEAHLFRKMNYLKHQACVLRDRIDPARASTAELDEIEQLMNEAVTIRTQIVRANMRLVLAIATRQFGRCNDLFERVSDGNYALIQAVEAFDFSLGNKFSTYATWAIRNYLMRAFRRKNRPRPHFLHGLDALLEHAPASCDDQLEQSEFREKRKQALTRLLARLDDRERRVIAGRFGIGGAPVQTLRQIGSELGISKERVRQLEAQAQAKLRMLALAEERILLPA